MTDYLLDLLHDLCAAADAALQAWRRCRWLRRYSNPDQCPF